MSDAVLYEVNGEHGIARITINRPDKLNALNAEVLGALSDAAAKAAADPEAKGVIVTGSGAKGFVAGADIDELAELDAPGAQQQAERRWSPRSTAGRSAAAASWRWPATCGPPRPRRALGCRRRRWV